MQELQGKFGTAKIFTNQVDEASLAQLRLLCDQPLTAGQRLRMMPDIHAGAGCTIGTTMTISDKIVPNLVGVDIGCGMHTVVLKEKRLEMQKLDRVIRDNIPSGMAVRQKAHKYASNVQVEALRCGKHVNIERALLSVGTLGGGNHFIEVDKDEDENLYLVIHSGSRYLGKQVAEYYQSVAYDKLSRCTKEETDAFVASLKAQGMESEIQAALKKFKKEKHCDVPKTLAYVQGEDFEAYLHDMRIVQEFADLNRRAMADIILREMKLTPADSFTTIHNYIDLERMILRKGAVSAQRGERLLIPMNMRDGSLLCIGKGNEDWNCSAPHGAGRLMSRHDAKQSLTVSEFKKQMQGIFSTSVNASTLDESPMAYKDMASIIENIAPTAEITKIIKPVYNFKASED